MTKQMRVVIETGEDKGKVFMIRKMPAVKGDRFMMRLLHGLAASGLHIEESQKVMGLLGMNQLTLNLLGSLSEELFLELMDEIVDYIDIVPEGGNARSLEPNIDIEDMFTLSRLRMAFVEHHVGFLDLGANPS